MGKFFVNFFFDGEIVLLSFFDKMQGFFIIAGGLVFYFLLGFIGISK